MIKLLLVGMFGALMASVTSYAGVYWQTHKSGVAHETAAPEGLELRKTKVMNVPMVAKGEVQGYIVAQFGFTAEAKVLKSLSVPPEVFLMDEAFREIYASPNVDFQHLETFDLPRACRKAEGADEGAAGRGYRQRRTRPGFQLRRSYGNSQMIAHLKSTPMPRPGPAFVAAGWIGLLGGAFIKSPIIELAGIPALAVSQRDVMAISQCLIISGLCIIILQAMRIGFSALDRFFSAALQRTHQSPAVMTPASMDVANENAVTLDHKKSVINGRPCLIYADGTVHVETLLGSRKFSSMQDAEEFVGWMIPPIEDKKPARKTVSG